MCFRLLGKEYVYFKCCLCFACFLHMFMRILEISGCILNECVLRNVEMSVCILNECFQLYVSVFCVCCAYFGNKCVHFE